MAESKLKPISLSEALEAQASVAAFGLKPLPGSYAEALEHQSKAGLPGPPPARKRQLQPLAPLDHTSWESFSGKARWDCQVALRGPDLRGSSGVKMVTTSVIRHRLSGCMRVGGLVNSSLSFMILPSPPPSDPTFDWSHFCGHVQEAAGWLGIPLTFISTDAWLEIVVKTGGTFSMWEKLIPELKEPYSSALAKLFKREDSHPVEAPPEIPPFDGGDL